MVLTLSAVAAAVALGLNVLYVVAGAALVVAVIVFARSFAHTTGRRWALSSVALPVLAALIVTPILIQSSGNPTVAFAPEDDARWIADGDGGGYAVTTSTITHVDATGAVDWERPADLATWSVDGGLVTGDRDRVRRITTDGEIAWERTGSDFGEEDVSPVARSGGITTVSACTSDFDSGAPVTCRFIGIDDSGAETYTVDGELSAAVFPGGLWHFANADGLGATGALPSHFGYEAPDTEGVTVVDAADGHPVTTLPFGGDRRSSVAFAGDRVLTTEEPEGACTVSRQPVADDPGWTAEVPCRSLGEGLFTTALLDGDVLWLRPNQSESDEGQLEAIALDLETGTTQEAGKVLWEDLGADEVDSALASGGSLLEIRDSTLALREPFSEATAWSVRIDGGFQYLKASEGVVAVVTRPDRPRLFGSADDWMVSAYALDDGRLLGQETFDPNRFTSVFPLGNAILLTSRDGTSIRIGA